VYRAYILSKSGGRLASARKERTGCSAWLPMAMRFASCQSARLRLRVSSHGLSKASLERELVIATVSGSTTPVEIRKIAQLASMYEWQ
jgi:hypothetical protein